MIRLEEMDEEDFRDCLARGIARHAEEAVRQGVWTPTSAEEASKAEFNQLLPRGRDTPGFRFCKVIEESSGRRVGETWFSLTEKGGKSQFWIHWLWVEPDSRRRGFAGQVLLALEQTAAKAGADRVGLSVLAENGPAMTLYSRHGYLPHGFRLTKSLRRED